MRPSFTTDGVACIVLNPLSTEAQSRASHNQSKGDHMKNQLTLTVFALATGLALTGCTAETCGEGLDCNPETHDDDGETADVADLDAENVGTAQQALESWLPPISEETGAALCPYGRIVTGAGCTGSNCDNVSVLCRTATGVRTNYAWTSYFSEEDQNYRICNGGFVSGIQCVGSYCDSMRLECVGVTGAARTPCFWTGSFSEEHFPVTIPEGYGVAGIACSGSFCDNLSLYYCKL
jgi:hypothetical protein